MTSTLQLSFALDGVRCGGCVGRAQRAIETVPGVRGAHVNLANARADVTADLGLSVAELTHVLSKAGYPAREKQVVLQLEGLSCGSCIARVEAALLAVPGVLSAHASLADGRARLQVLDGDGDDQALLNASSQAGYQAIVINGGDRDVETPKERSAREQRDLRKRTFWAALLTFPVFVLEMGGHLVPSFHHWVMATIGQTVSWTLQAILVSMLLVGPGRQFLTIGFSALWRRAPDMNSLVALGTTAAFSYSMVACFLPGVLPVDAVAVYFESAAVIVTLILVGRLLEARAKGQTGAAIQALAGLQPATAHRLPALGEPAQEVLVADIRSGDLIRLRPGERVAVDGVVVQGQGPLDEAMLSGEPIPVFKSNGDRVSAGTVNGASPLVIQTTDVGQHTRLSQIIAMVERAQAVKLPVQALVDRITLWFVPAILGVAVITFLIWLSLGGSVSAALVASVSVLIIACPCAMGLATPTSIMVGLGRAAEQGILFRKGTALQSLEGVQLVAFDKTGTLTEGKPALIEAHCAPNVDKERLLSQVAALEAQSEHPIGKALVRAAPSDGINVEAVDVSPGQGISGLVAGERLAVGTFDYIATSVDIPESWQRAAREASAKGATPVFVARDGAAAAVLMMLDQLKPEAASAISALKQQGLKVAMISGDTVGAATHIAARLGIDIVYGACLPEQKLERLAELKAVHGAVAFVGDGINDVPALAAADCGIALGTGTDVAMEAGEVVLSAGTPQGVVSALQMSRAIMRNIRQNLVWAFGYNVLMVPVAAGILVPFGGPMLSPMLAAGAMAGSSVLVLANALRLRRGFGSIHDTLSGQQNKSLAISG
ncbi:heavy metal translocating P-type ATPase [Epibacterium ulvae]|uniref:heavy metal translocating P-type ATPase n=1 Tax=Epibacterium ulvae TaxID=1156985 RepID=UPI0024924AED|nr:copper-translocating P-type ATPase [Epibacterium ulvae]